MTFTKGYVPSVEHRNRIRIALKGQVISEEAKRKMSAAKIGKKQSIEVRMKQSLRQRGDKTNFWKGGITKPNAKFRNSIEYSLWREAVFARDNWTCQDCTRRGIYLHAHHLKPFSTHPELRLAIDNGIALCKKCHSLRHPEINLFRAKG